MTNTQHMHPRLDYAKAAPGAREAMYAVERYVRECGFERRLLELVKLRASQINGARTALTCIRKTLERTERRSRGCTPLWFGERPLSSPNGNALRWRGPRPSHW